MTDGSQGMISQVKGLAEHIDSNFQEKIFQALLIDHQWSAQMVEVMTHEYFELKYLQYLCDRFFGSNLIAALNALIAFSNSPSSEYALPKLLCAPPWFGLILIASL